MAEETKGEVSADDENGSGPSESVTKFVRRGPMILPPHEELILNGWRLVRHTPAKDRWHNASDHLEGYEEYGDQSGGDHPNAPQWSVKYSDEEFDQFLFATGDGTKWSVIARSELDAKPTSALALSVATNPKIADQPRLVDVLRSSANPSPHRVRMLHNPNQKAQPWVTLRDHEASKRDDGHGFLYGGNNFHLAPASTSPDAPASEGYDNSVLPQEFGLRSVKHCGGANVYIRRRDNGSSGGGAPPSLALCLKFNLVATSSGKAGSDSGGGGGEAPAKKKGSDGYDAVGAARMAVLEVLDAELTQGVESDQGMRLLWRRAPAAVLLGLAHGFYRGEIVEWLGRELKHEDLPKTTSEIDDASSAALAAAQGGTAAATKAGAGLVAAAAAGPSGGDREKRGRGLGSKALELSGGCECGDKLWPQAACVPAVLAAVTRLHAGGVGGGGYGSSGGPVKAFLLDVALRGALLGPVRRALSRVTEIGPDLGGGWKWCGAVKVPDGRVFFLPRNAPLLRVLVLEPSSGAVTLLDHPFGESFNQGSRNKFNGAVLGPDGCVYGIPASTSRVLRIKPALKKKKAAAATSSEREDVMSLVGPATPGRWKWGQGVLAGDGVIYCAPHHRHTVLRIDATKCRKRHVCSSSSSSGGGGGGGGSEGEGDEEEEDEDDDEMVQVTESEQSFHAEGVSAAAAQAGGSSTLLSSKWFGAAYSPAAQPGSSGGGGGYGGLGCVYFTPFNAAHVLQFDLASQRGRTVGDEALLHSGGEKYHGACLSQGLVVACPANRGGRRVLVLDPKQIGSTAPSSPGAAGQEGDGGSGGGGGVVLAGPDLGGEHYKWHDTVTGADGKAYGIPHHSGKVRGGLMKLVRGER